MNMALSNPVPYYVTAAVTTVGVIGGAYYAYRFYQETKNSFPTEWKRVGHLKRIYTYPIKSCAPVALDHAELSWLGLRAGWLRDRVLMIVNEKDNNFINARTYNELLHLQSSFNKAILTLTHPDMEPIHINLAEVMLTNKRLKATVWGTPVPVYDCGEEVQKWLTKFLNRPDSTYRLVYYASTKNRMKMAVPKIYKKFRSTDTGAFPDEMPYNIINESSLNDLNKRLKGLQVNEANFRPNFMVSGAEPYDEDKWKYIRIGQNVFEVVKDCNRCVLTTIDPETGIPDKDMEPLKTLRSYRLPEDPEERKAVGDAPRMGVNMALRSEPGHIISINDPIYAAY